MSVRAVTRRERFRAFGGHNPETAALRNVLEYYGVADPRSGDPLSETMLLGIGGGVGAGYFLFQFCGEPSVWVGTRHLWENPKKFMEATVLRLGARPKFTETSGARAAEANLRRELEQDRPAILSLDLQGMPYFHLSASASGYFYHTAVAYALEGDTVRISDLAPEPFTVTMPQLAAARARITSQKNRMLTLEGLPKRVDLKRAVEEGLRACVQGLGAGKIANFGLTALEKWAGLVNHPKDKKGWPKVLASGKGTYRVLLWVYAAIETYATPGAGFRGAYAEFLEAAASILDSRAVAAAADRYRAAAKCWTAVAGCALPFPVARDLLRRRASFTELPDTNARLQELERSEVPLAADEQADLFAELEHRLRALCEAERKACAALVEAIS